MEKKEMNKEMNSICLVFLVFLIFLQFLDVITTLYGINSGLAYEKTPIVNKILFSYGGVGFIFFKLIYILILIYIYKKNKKRAKPVFTVVLYLLNIVYIYVVLNNLNIIFNLGLNI